MTDTNPDRPRWLSVEQIRKQQRMGRKKVIEAMESGALPYERRGRTRWARVEDIDSWEKSRVKPSNGGDDNLSPAILRFTQNYV